MPENHISSALFVHTENTAHFIDRLQNNAFGTDIHPVLFDTLLQDPGKILKGIDHVVVAGTLDVIKSILNLAMNYKFSVGLLPADTQKDLIRFYDLPKGLDASIDLALQKNARAMDVILCNEKIVLFNATVGRMPLLDSPGDVSRPTVLFRAFKRIFGLKLLLFDLSISDQKVIRTAASGCMVIQNRRGSLASRLIAHDSAIADGMSSTVVSAPISVVAYLKFLIEILRPSPERKKIPSATGYIKSSEIHIDSETRLHVFIDGERASHTPLHCVAIPQTVRINLGERVWKEKKDPQDSREKLEVDNLPRGKELVKVRKRKKIPFFSYASEERFRDLFSALRTDARIDGIYMVLMVLSTLLATVGLYLNSASVVIGAMLLAPLMTPIVSLAMGLLRGDKDLIKNSLWKVLIGIAIALLASALITLLFPHKPITNEMQARLNPTLLDLAVAVVSGIAAAYSKSFKEIIQSLAGVAIAVALVPPLAVAGIGIGRMDFQFFSQAFLLFATNFIGIILAATFTFRALGYSPAVRSKRNLGIVLIMLLFIAIPLYLSYNRIVEDIVFEKSLKTHRFLVNGKYIIIQKADIRRRRNTDIIDMHILARELLTRADLNEFKKKIQGNSSRKLVIRANTIYIP